MAYKVFLRNYSPKLKQLPLFSFVIIVLFFFGCSNSKEETREKPLILTKKTIEFFEGGKPQINELFTTQNGELVLYGYEELYESGNLKITGKYSVNKKREGLWKSFYEDGTSWSIGSYENGIETGEKRVWYPNGKLRYKGEMKNDQPFDSWQFWDKEGRKTVKVYK